MDFLTTAVVVFTFFGLFLFSLTGVLIKNKYLRIFLTIVSLVMIVFVISGYKGAKDAEYYGDYGYCEFGCGTSF